MGLWVMHMSQQSYDLLHLILPINILARRGGVVIQYKIFAYSESFSATEYVIITRISIGFQPTF